MGTWKYCLRFLPGKRLHITRKWPSNFVETVRAKVESKFLEKYCLDYLSFVPRRTTPSNRDDFSCRSCPIPVAEIQ